MSEWRKSLVLVLAAFSLASCTNFQKRSPEPLVETATTQQDSKSFSRGRFVGIQGATSAHETMINILVPRQKTYIFQVTGPSGALAEVEKYQTVNHPSMLWKVEKLHVKKLSPGVAYKLTIIDEFRGKQRIVDEREFGTLDLGRQEVTFAFATCMADDPTFDAQIDPMWEKLIAAAPDMIVLGGDLVYVDSFDFVERQKATEQDIWLRYIATLDRLPVYKTKRLIPILATWDDHDFGTNDGDREFKSKHASRKVFQAFFSGRPIAGVYEPGTDSVRSSFIGFNQRFFFMDDRTFRQPKAAKKPEAFGQWGEKQHTWLLSNLRSDTSPAWIFNGGQFFNGKGLDFKETFQGDHPRHFDTFLKDLKQVKAPVVFGSGDIHFSEIMSIDRSRLGYQTYELTSSAMHSYARDKEWENPLRLVSTPKFNFLLVKSRSENGGLKISAESRGIDEKPYFNESLTVHR